MRPEASDGINSSAASIAPAMSVACGSEGTVLMPLNAGESGSFSTKGDPANEITLNFEFVDAERSRRRTSESISCREPSGMDRLRSASTTSVPARSGRRTEIPAIPAATSR